MSSNKEKKDTSIPRYSKNIYLSQLKHLTRTLNTFIVYESVKRIFIKFSKSKNKYQLFLDINNIVEEIDYSDKLILVYDKSVSDTLLYNESEILKVIDSPDSKEKQQIDVLDNLSKLIKKYTDTNSKTNINNDFFKKDIEQTLDEINSILPSNVITQYKPKNKDFFVKTMVEKKIYYLIKNQMTFSKLNKVSSLENDRTSTKQNIIDLVKEEIKILNKNIKYLKHNKLPHIFPSDMETIATKQEIENAIQYYYDDSVEKYNLSSYTLEELKEQLFLINSKKEKGVYEPKSKSFIRQIDYDIGLKVDIYFKDFIVFTNYCIANNKNFTSNSISRYIKNIDNELEMLKIKNKEELAKIEQITGIKRKNITGLKRRIKIKELTDKYSYILNMDKDDKFYYITKLTELYNNAHLYSDISDKLDNALMSLNIYIPDMEDVEELLSNVSKETLEEIAYQQSQEKELEVKRDKLDISKEDYEFNNFYSNLLDEIKTTMQFHSPITVEEFEEYLEFLNSHAIMEKYFKDIHDGSLALAHINSSNKMLQYINTVNDTDIYERIESDLEKNVIKESQKIKKVEIDPNDEIPF